MRDRPSLKSVVCKMPTLQGGSIFGGGASHALYALSASARPAFVTALLRHENRSMILAAYEEAAHLRVVWHVGILRCALPFDIGRTQPWCLRIASILTLFGLSDDRGARCSDLGCLCAMICSL